MKRFSSAIITIATLSLASTTARAETAAPAQAQAQAQTQAHLTAPPITGYKKGFFIRSSDDKFALTIQGRVQARYVFERVDADDDNEAQFSIARARMTLKGHAYSKNIKYKFQTDYGKGNVVLKDFFVDYRVGDSPVRIRTGQWKRPFSRQQINSSSRLELVDRAITDKAFGSGRDIGIAIHNNYEKSPEIEWALGVFDGTGDKPRFSGDVVVDPMTGEGEVEGGKFSNVPSKLRPAVVARVGYNHGGIKGYSEADFAGGPMRFAVGASALFEGDFDADDSTSIRSEVDFVVKAMGFSTTGGVYMAADGGSGGFDPSYAAFGFHGQTGYLIDSTYQPVVRYAMVNPDGGDNNTQEIAAGFSLYSQKHNFKWQTDAGALIASGPGDSTTDLLVRTQLQLSF